MQNMPELSPTKELLNGFKYGNISEEEFTTKFDNYLSNISPSNIVGQLEAISMLQGGKDIVLVCYEKTGDFCHRHIKCLHLEDELKENKIQTDRTKTL